MERVDKKGKCGKPSGCKYQVHRPAEDATGEWEEPQQAQQDGNSGNHLGIDEPLLGPGIFLVEIMEVGPNETGDNLDLVSICGAETVRNIRWQI